MINSIMLNYFFFIALLLKLKKSCTKIISSWSWVKNCFSAVVYANN